MREDKAGGSAWQIIYLEKAERAGYPWMFVLYKGAHGWSIQSFHIKDDLDPLFGR